MHDKINLTHGNRCYNSGYNYVTFILNSSSITCCSCVKDTEIPRKYHGPPIVYFTI